jgi:catechol 2,3-dioxygenase-like lactoylglutathione lyase family enzyme
MSDTAVIHPQFHHVNLKTARLQEMIDYYSALVGAEVLFQYELGAWLSNDIANHRIALLAFPNFAEDPEKDTRVGMHHIAFEYAVVRGAERELPAREGSGNRPRLLPRPRDDVLVLLPRPRRQPHRAAGRQLRRLVEVDRLDAPEQRVPRGPDREVRRPGSRRGRICGGGEPFDQIHARAMAGELVPEAEALELPKAEAWPCAW